MRSSKFRNLIDTYRFFEKVFENFSELSLNKQASIAFLKWALDHDHPVVQDEFVRVLKLWRKSRVGGHRTLLERKSRKVFLAVQRREESKKRKKRSKELQQRMREEKKGHFTPEIMEESRKKRAAMVGNHPCCAMVSSKIWVVTAPDGVEFITVGLQRFARYAELDPFNLMNTGRIQSPRKTCKGYKCKKYNPEVDYDLPVLVFYPEEPDRAPEHVGSLADVPYIAWQKDVGRKLKPRGRKTGSRT